MPDPVDDRTLPPADLEAISAAVLNAYPEPEALFTLLLSQWGVRVSDFVHTEQAGKLVITALVEWAHAQGKVLDLLSLALDFKRKEVWPLEQVAVRLLKPLESHVVRKARPNLGFAFTGAEKPPATPSIAAGPDNATELLIRLRGAVCLVQVNGAPAGTGFLIGPRSVLTSYTVVGRAIEQGSEADAIRLRFGTLQDGAETVMSVAPGRGWLGAFSEHGWVAVAIENEALALDFALLRLAEAVAGNRPILALPSHVPIVPPGQQLHILQHPHGGPLRLDSGPLLQYSQIGTRVYYTVDTAPGSAGAPVLTSAGELIALHHVTRWEANPGEPNARLGQGVPIWRIRQAIVEAGLDPAEL